jgi:hypothetical protein
MDTEGEAHSLASDNHVAVDGEVSPRSPFLEGTARDPACNLGDVSQHSETGLMLHVVPLCSSGQCSCRHGSAQHLVFTKDNGYLLPGYQITQAGISGEGAPSDWRANAGPLWTI